MPQKCLCLNPGWGALERDFTILFLPGGIPSLLTAAVSFLAQPWPTLSTLNLNAQLPRTPEQGPSLSSLVIFTGVSQLSLSPTNEYVCPQVKFPMADLL